MRLSQGKAAAGFNGAGGINHISTALILDIQRMSTEDGPGIRTTVFFKGCNLSCAWCHNPESISPKNEVQWIEARCISCGCCRQACKNDALCFFEGGIKIKRNSCKSCLACVGACPANALEARGERWDIEKLVHEVLKDRAYFEKSNGGVTVSGGEALLQQEFLCEFLKRLKTEGIHTALDTAGMVPFGLIYGVIPHVDLLLYDIKLIDPALHRKFTGHGNELILNNILSVTGMVRNNKIPMKLWIRTPVIPGATSEERNIRGIGRYIARNFNDIAEKWELCAFNNLCKEKYRRLDMEWPYKDVRLLSREEMERLAETARESGVRPEIVFWSGITRVEE